MCDGFFLGFSFCFCEKRNWGEGFGELETLWWLVIEDVLSFCLICRLVLGWRVRGISRALY